MKTLRKEILSEVIGDVKQSAKIYQFPVIKPEHKVDSMACHRCEMKDWDFSRGF